MFFDAHAYAEGICSKAAGSTIEVLVDELDFLIDNILDDAITYRRYDSDGDLSTEQEDLDTAERYEITCDNLKVLRREIVAYERENGEGTSFAERED